MVKKVTINDIKFIAELTAGKLVEDGDITKYVPRSEEDTKTLNNMIRDYNKQNPKSK